MSEQKMAYMSPDELKKEVDAVNDFMEKRGIEPGKAAVIYTIAAQRIAQTIGGITVIPIPINEDCNDPNCKIHHPKFDDKDIN